MNYRAQKVSKSSVCNPQPPRQHSKVKLPDPSTLPLFQYYDPATDSLQDKTYPDVFQPRRIDNYVLEPAVWRPTNLTYSLRRSRRSRTSCLGTGPARVARTRASILAYGLGDEEPCRVCGRQGKRCFGDSCVRSFRQRTERAARGGRLRIERTAGNIKEGGGGAATTTTLGYGVFAAARILTGDPCLCDVVSYPHVPPKGSEPPWRTPELA
ncbi:hypothetical protein UCDDA912_g03541 [Diaporthe ampelina]|uniref:Uncharacterized protein n=1 Tax=Diaporthe ampelina TaxID=1214573 RepID=A0A0G2I9P6_9PEZI|nr:hypothetical protein UCDDA912_g03541 [Diaporthe ampelina]